MVLPQKLNEAVNIKDIVASTMQVSDVLYLLSQIFNNKINYQTVINSQVGYYLVRIMFCIFYLHSER